METDAYDLAEAIAEQIADGGIPELADMHTPSGGELQTSFVIVLESRQRFKVTVKDVSSLGDDEDEED